MSPPPLPRLPLNSSEPWKLRSPSSFPTCLTDIPLQILTSIFNLIAQPRHRNAMSLVCIDWYILERSTRTRLNLRGFVQYLPALPRSFQAVEILDLSNFSPWGYSIFYFQRHGTGHETLHLVLQEAFPNVRDLTVYVRDAVDVHLVSWIWPGVQRLKLVRFHQRAMQPEVAAGVGMELQSLVQNCVMLKHLDLSTFYCWTEDIPPLLEAHSGFANSLISLDILKLSPEGFKTQELMCISSACRNLEELYALCEFDPRFLDSVGDDCLVHVANSCSSLRVLHLVETHQFGKQRGIPQEGFSSEDANITRYGLESIFRALPNLESLALILGQNVRDSAAAFETLASHCKKLKALQIGNVHGICQERVIDGIAKCSILERLSISHCADLSDGVLESIGLGCSRLQKLDLNSCSLITEVGLSRCVNKLLRTLVDVEVKSCKCLSTPRVVRALLPLQPTLRRLHLDVVLTNDDDDINQEALVFGFGQSVMSNVAGPFSDIISTGADTDQNMVDGTLDLIGLLDHNLDSQFDEHNGMALDGFAGDTSRMKLHELREVPNDLNKGVYGNIFGWRSLTYLSLWVPCYELLSLASIGMDVCPMLREIIIRVEGDCRQFLKPPAKQWSLKSFVIYPKLLKLVFDLSEIVGYALSAPGGSVDLSLWERFYLNGIQNLNLEELDYWPPSDKDVNHRGITLPAAGILSETLTLRKLFIHGTSYEHLFFMLLRIWNLRDVQLREDYYPTPEDDTSTEMRAESCRRFEKELLKRGFPD